MPEMAHCFSAMFAAAVIVDLLPPGRCRRQRRGRARRGAPTRRRARFFVVAEDDPHRHPDPDLLDRAVDEVGRQAEPGLLGKLDDGHHVGGLEPGQPGMVVDGVAGQRRPPADRFGPDVFGLVSGADRDGGMQVVPAIVATQEDELPVRAHPARSGGCERSARAARRRVHSNRSLNSPSGAAPVWPSGSLAPCPPGLPFMPGRDRYPARCVVP